MASSNGWKPLTITKNNSTQDPAKVLDPTVILIKMVYKLNVLSERLVPKQSHPKPKSIM